MPLDVDTPEIQRRAEFRLARRPKNKFPVTYRSIQAILIPLSASIGAENG
jgi:hypothetical protein